LIIFILIIEFPHECIFYRGPHSVECLLSIWIAAGCTVDGSKAPNKLNRAELAAFSELTLV